MLDNTEFCLRCLMDESWMKDSSIRTSCTGPQVRQIDGVSEIVRTSNLASSMAAHLSAEQLRGHVIGAQHVMNRRLTYTAYPNLELSVSHPMRKRNCPAVPFIHPKKSSGSTAMCWKLRSRTRWIRSQVFFRQPISRFPSIA